MAKYAALEEVETSAVAEAGIVQNAEAAHAVSRSELKAVMALH